jgi:hypothetical protein
MANLRVLHIDLDTGKVVAQVVVGGPIGEFVEKAGDTMTGFLFLNPRQKLPFLIDAKPSWPKMV